MTEESPKKATLLEKFWVPIIVALIGASGVIIAAVLSGVLSNDASTPTPAPVLTQSPFSYQVQVQVKDTGEFISDAKVTVEVGGKAPLDSITDANGVARIFIDPSYKGQPGFLIVEAAGYERHTQNVNLVEGTLPYVVLLEVEAPKEPEPPEPKPVTFSYQVRVQAKDTGEYVPNAKVTIEVGGKAPLDGITDVNGVARIFIASSYAGQPGCLIVEAPGYERHRQNIDLVEGTLPYVVLLEVEAPREPVTFSYQVRVQAKDTGEYVPNAKVTIEVGGKAPLDGITDVNGVARIFIASFYAGQPGFLIVEVPGYERHRQDIDLIESTLPDVVVLEPTHIPQTAKTTTPTPEAVVVVGALNLRPGPGINYDPPICTLNHGEILNIQGRIASNKWIQIIPVSFPETLGWVSASSEHVQINVDLADIPIVEPPPLPIPTPLSVTPTIVITVPPILLGPPDGASSYRNRMDLSWDWLRTLGPDDYFQVEIRNRRDVFFQFDESVPVIDRAWVKEKSYHYDIINEAYDREYKWRIIVVKGKPPGEKQWSTLEHRVWEPSSQFELISQPSEMRTLYVEPGEEPVYNGGGGGNGKCYDEYGREIPC